MIKDKDILIRIDKETKNSAKEKAKSIGLSVSSWIRTLIIKDLKS
jgi:antitoxin component of RelBE/YafQ-DinJ toxin-antitoxin module